VLFEGTSCRHHRNLSSHMPSSSTPPRNSYAKPRAHSFATNYSIATCNLGPSICSNNTDSLGFVGHRRCKHTSLSSPDLRSHTHSPDAMHSTAIYSVSTYYIKILCFHLPTSIALCMSPSSLNKEFRHIRSPSVLKYTRCGPSSGIVRLLTGGLIVATLNVTDLHCRRTN
jgi:hypothetical protein